MDKYLVKADGRTEPKRSEMNNVFFWLSRSLGVCSNKQTRIYINMKATIFAMSYKTCSINANKRSHLKITFFCTSMLTIMTKQMLQLTQDLFSFGISKKMFKTYRSISSCNGSRFWEFTELGGADNSNVECCAGLDSPGWSPLLFRRGIFVTPF